MKNAMDTTAFLLALFAVGCIVGHCTGCNAVRMPEVPAYCKSEDLFTAAVLSCTDKSSTREQSQACKRDLQASCGFVETVTDGGAP